MRTLNTIILVIILIQVSYPQNNPDDDCPASPTYLVGDYQITDVQAIVGNNSNTENFESCIYGHLRALFFLANRTYKSKKP